MALADQPTTFYEELGPQDPQPAVKIDLEGCLFTKSVKTLPQEAVEWKVNSPDF